MLLFIVCMCKQKRIGLRVENREMLPHLACLMKREKGFLNGNKSLNFSYFLVIREACNGMMHGGYYNNNNGSMSMLLQRQTTHHSRCHPLTRHLHTQFGTVTTLLHSHSPYHARPYRYHKFYLLNIMIKIIILIRC